MKENLKRLVTKRSMAALSVFVISCFALADSGLCLMAHPAYPINQGVCTVGYLGDYYCNDGDMVDGTCGPDLGATAGCRLFQTNGQLNDWEPYPSGTSCGDNGSYCKNMGSDGDVVYYEQSANDQGPCPIPQKYPIGGPAN